MIKSKDDTITQFNEQVNMTAEELETWLKDPMSKKAGTGVGLESAQKIIAILKKNPTKDPNKYDEEDLDDMRKVVGYNKRHLAQEDHLKDTKSKEELEKAKSTISLKNWGHDPLKNIDGAKSSETSKEGIDSNETEAEKSDKATDQADANADEDEDATNVGSKRKHDDIKVKSAEDSEDVPADEDGQTEENSSADEGDGEEEDEPDKERARKKSKTDSADHRDPSESV